jgi:hypothetical protein
LARVTDPAARNTVSEFLQIMRSQLFNNAREIQELRTNEFLRAKGLQSCLRRRKASAPLRKPSKPASKKQKSTPSHYPLTKRPAVDQGEEAEAVAAAAVGVAAISTTVSSNNNDHLISNSTSSNSPNTINTVQRIRQRPRSNNNVAVWGFYFYFTPPFI